MPANPNDFDYSFWNRTRTPNPGPPDLYRDQRERERKSLRHELTKTLAVKPLSCRDSHGNYRGTKGELLDPAALFHLGIEVPGPTHVEPGEPDWTIDVDPRRPTIGDILSLYVPMRGNRDFLQIFNHTQAGPVPDGHPQPIHHGRLPSGASIYACDHHPPPNDPQPSSFCEFEPVGNEWRLRNQNCHPEQYAHLDPALIAQLLPHPHARFLPDARPYPWDAPADLPPVFAEAWRQARSPSPSDTKPSETKPTSVETKPKPSAPTPSLPQPASPVTGPNLPEASADPQSLAPPPALPHPSPSGHPVPSDNVAPSGHHTQPDHTAKTEKSVFTPTDPTDPTAPAAPQPDPAGNTPPSFPPDQQRVLHLLEQGYSVVDAMNKLELSRDTFYTWRKRRPAFREAAAAARDRYCESIAGDMDLLTNQARQEIETWMQSDQAPIHIRIAATEFFLRHIHTNNLLPRTLEELIPHTLAQHHPKAEPPQTAEITTPAETETPTPSEVLAPESPASETPASETASQKPITAETPSLQSTPAETSTPDSRMSEISLSTPPPATGSQKSELSPSQPPPSAPDVWRRATGNETARRRAEDLPAYGQQNTQDAIS